MLRVPLIQARPGMQLATPVLHPDRPDTMLLRAGFTLDERSIERLRSMFLPEIWIEYPDLRFIEKFISPKIAQQRGATQKMLTELFDRLSSNANAKLDYATYRNTIRDFVQSLIDEPDAALYIQAMSEGNRPLLRHSADVTFLSLLMGLKLDAYLIAQRKRLAAHRAKEVVALGVGAMLHDIGMLEIEEKAIQHFYKTNDESDPEFRRHVELAYDHINGELDAPAAAAILHHHQHFDGTGFPAREDGNGEIRGLVGEEIHIFARILTAADLFDRLRYPNPEGGPIPTVAALNALRQEPFRDWIDPIVFKALLSVVPAYAPGTVVMLSNGERGAVVDWDPSDPCRPSVQQIASLEEISSGSGTSTGVKYVLTERRDLTIVEADGRDVSEHNFFPRHDAEFTLLGTETQAAA
ncbi:MAG: HD-GYP domain-containing protein [Phycisphaerales bacterium JB065]